MNIRERKRIYRTEETGLGRWGKRMSTYRRLRWMPDP